MQDNSCKTRLSLDKTSSYSAKLLSRSFRFYIDDNLRVFRSSSWIGGKRLKYELGCKAFTANLMVSYVFYCGLLIMGLDSHNCETHKTHCTQCVKYVL